MVRSGRRLAGITRSAITVVTATLIAAVSVIGASSGTATAATPTPYGLAALWNMNDTSRPVMDDSGPNGLDGTIGSDVQIGVSVGGATGYRFPRVLRPADEPFNPERLATVPSNPALNPDGADYAIEFRYRTTRNFGNIVQKGQNQTWGGYFKFEQPRGRMTCLFKYTEPGTGAASQIAVKAPESMTTNDGQWHTIRCELRRSFGVILFIDGVEAAKKGGSLPAIANDRPVSIGGKSNCDQISVTCDYFDGDIDYVRIEKGASSNQPPVMTFTSNCNNLTCTFNSAGSSDPDGTIASRSWNLGDGTTRTGTSFSHTYSTPGTYTVTLTGTDNQGASSTTQRDVTTNLPPEMRFTVDCDELRCTFDSAGSSDPDGTIVNRRWNFGDGDTSQGATATHTYASADTYTVTLTGTDNEGLTGTATADLTVSATPPPPPPPPPGEPNAVFTHECVALTCTFDSAASTADGGIVSRTWTFGEPGATSTATAPTHTFTEAGTYTVGLTVRSAAGATASTQRAITVTAAASFPPGERPSRFVPLTPARLFDTRPGEPGAGPKGVVAGDTSITVPLTGIPGLPASGVSAVAINVTAIALDAPSFVTVSPTDDARPTASSLNLTTAGQVRANLVIVPVASDGTISLYTLRDAHLLGDVAGYFTEQATPAAAGRIVTQTPERLFDTRPDESAPGPKGIVPADGFVDVDVLGRAGVPDSGVAAVVLTVTATASLAPGFVTVWDGDGDRPVASSININTPGETVPNQVIVPVGADGSIRVYSSGGGHLLADVSGYVTDDTASPSMTGLFVPVTPDRVFDTRPGEPGPGPKGVVNAAATITPEFAGVAGIDPDAGGVVINVTMIGTAPAFASAWPDGGTQPTASVVNVGGPGDVRASGAIVALGAAGDVTFFASTDAHLLADVTGYLIR